MKFFAFVPKFRLDPKIAGLLAIGILALAAVAQMIVLPVSHIVVIYAVATVILAGIVWFVLFEPSQRAAADRAQRLRESREVFRSLYTYNTDAIVTYDLEGRIVESNVAAITLIGREPGELIGQRFASYIAPTSVHEVGRHFAQAITGVTTEFEADLLAANDRKIEVLARFSPIMVDGQVTGMHGIARDLTGKRHLEREAAKQAERVRALYLVGASTGKAPDEQILDTLRFGVLALGISRGYLTKISGGVVTITHNKNGGEEFRPGRQIPLEQTLSRFSFGAKDVLAIDDLGVEPWISDPSQNIHPWRSYIGCGIEVKGVPYGTLVFLGTEPRSEPWTETDKDFVHLMSGLVGSAIERGQHYHKLDRMAFYDTLTDLPNRIFLNDRVANALSVAKRHEHSVALHYLDLDGFKPVNDTLGHTAGDNVLRQVAGRLSKVVRETDTLARIGGDEFVVLQPLVHAKSEAEALANRLLEAIHWPFDIDGRKVTIGVSIGVALYPENAADGSRLLDLADAALYDAKHMGKNQISFYTPPPIPQESIS